ncbi:hypothetical protein [Aeromonas hydrophila]|uniref:hypothetical protein n=1 Tax=Aeromonas hydrophila TaxID=644 RepID=UPI0039882E06
MAQELPLSPYTRQWLGLIAAGAGIHPHRDGERWLLHLTPSYPGARTITMQIRWHSTHWQLLSISNAGDWPSMSELVDEICVYPKRSCFWRCQAGPVSLTEQPRVLASFLADLQRICTNRGFTVVSDLLAQEEIEDE